MQRFRRTLNTSSNKSIRLRRELTWLNDLLSLEHFGDFDTEESGHFAMIDPEDPVVWSICTLTEGVADLIEGLDALQAQVGGQ